MRIESFIYEAQQVALFNITSRFFIDFMNEDKIKNGFFNSLDKKSVKKILVEQINNFMVCNKTFGIYLAPFITLKYSK